MILFQIITTLIGCAVLTLSISLFFYFISARKAIGRAVAYMLAGESVGLFITILFSLTSNGVFDFLGPRASLVARVVLFSTAAFTSIHLAYQTRKIELGMDEGID